MSEYPTWKIIIDTDDDGAYDSGEDITAYVLRLDITRGLKSGRADIPHVADGMTCNLIVDDTSGLFSPEAAAAGSAEAGRYVRVEAVYSAVTYTLFVGPIDHLEPAEESYRTKIVARGRWAYADFRVDVSPYAGPLRPDEIIFDVLPDIFFRLPLTDSANGRSYLQLDTSLLDSTEIAQTPYDYKSIDAGRSTFTYVGQDYDRPTLRHFFGDLVQAENGFLVELASGLLKFANRHHIPGATTLDATWDSSEVAIEYAYGDEIYNEVYLNLIANVVLAGATLWTSVAPIRFKTGESTRVIRFLQGDGRLRAVESDFTASGFVFKDAASSGTVVNPSYWLEPLSTGAKLHMSNNTGAPVYLQVGATIVGDALVKETPLRQTVTDVQSRTLYGVRPFELNLPSFADIEEAENRAQALIGAYSTPRGLVRSVTLHNDTAAHLVQQLSLEMFQSSYVVVTLPRKNHSGTYAVVGVQQQLDMTTGALVTKFILTPRAGFWQMANSVLYTDRSVLDVTTILGY